MGMMTEICKCQWHAVVSKQFTKKNKDGSEEVIKYYQAVFFPVDDNGEVSDEPQQLTIPKEVAPLFKAIEKGEIVMLKLGSFVQNPKVIDFKRS